MHIYSLSLSISISLFVSSDILGFWFDSYTCCYWSSFKYQMHFRSRVYFSLTLNWSGFIIVFGRVVMEMYNDTRCLHCRLGLTGCWICSFFFAEFAGAYIRFGRRFGSNRDLLSQSLIQLVIRLNHHFGEDIEQVLVLVRHLWEVWKNNQELEASSIKSMRTLEYICVVSNIMMDLCWWFGSPHFSFAIFFFARMIFGRVWESCTRYIYYLTQR